MKHYLGKNVSIVCVLENFPDDGVVPAASAGVAAGDQAAGGAASAPALDGMAVDGISSGACGISHCRVVSHEAYVQ